MKSRIIFIAVIVVIIAGVFLGKLIHEKTFTEKDSALIIDEELPDALVDMVKQHFQAMNDGDTEAFNKTLAPEDGADLNNEPCTMETFEYYKESGMYVKEIRAFSEVTQANCVLEVVVWNPKENAKDVYHVVVSERGISRYLVRSGV